MNGAIGNKCVGGEVCKPQDRGKRKQERTFNLENASTKFGSGMKANRLAFSARLILCVYDLSTELITHAYVYIRMFGGSNEEFLQKFRG